MPDNYHDARRTAPPQSSTDPARPSPEHSTAYQGDSAPRLRSSPSGSPRPQRRDVRRCASCGEDYSVTYRNCPFCEEDQQNMRRSATAGRRVIQGNVRPQGGNRSQGGSRSQAGSRSQGGSRTQGGSRSQGRNRSRSSSYSPRTFQAIGLVAILVVVIAIVFLIVRFVRPLFSPAGDASSSGSGSSVSTSVSSSTGSSQGTSVSKPGPAPTGIILDRQELELRPGESWQFTVTLSPEGVTLPVTWTSSDATIATVDDYGTVRMVYSGTDAVSATISATCGTQRTDCIVRCNSASGTGQTGTQGTVSPGSTGKISASGGLNIRSGPGTTYDIIATAPDNSTVTILGESDGWYQIDFGRGQTGYVSKDYVVTG